jgi:hypothetical protein
LQTVLLVGMKLQQIITSFALDVMGGVEKKKFRKRGSKQDARVLRKNTSDLKLEKIHPIKPRDDLFWFHRPKLLLYLVHFMLFQVSFGSFSAEQAIPCQVYVALIVSARFTDHISILVPTAECIRIRLLLLGIGKQQPGMHLDRCVFDMYTMHAH